MAEVLMSKRTSELEQVARVSSAGLLEGGRMSPPEVVDLMASVGADLSRRSSRQVTAEALERSDLVLTMERFQLRELAVMTPTTWRKTFTLKELIRRSARIGPRLEDEPIGSWTARAHAGRVPAEMLDGSRVDEVADPYGGSRKEYAATKLELEELVGKLADLIFVSGPVVSDSVVSDPVPAQGVTASP